MAVVDQPFGALLEYNDGKSVKMTTSNAGRCRRQRMEKAGDGSTKIFFFKIAHFV